MSAGTLTRAARRFRLVGFAPLAASAGLAMATAVSAPAVITTGPEVNRMTSPSSMRRLLRHSSPVEETCTEAAM